MVNEKGIILLSVIIVLVTVALIGASLMSFFFSVDLAARTTINEAKAFYLAEAGIAQAVNSLRTQSGVSVEPEKTIGPIELGEGTYEVKIDFVQSSIISTGRVADSKKVLQLQYNAL